MPDINLDFGYGGTGTPGNGAAADATDLDNNQLDNGGLANIDNVNGNLTPPPSNEPPAINPDGSKDNPSNNNNDNNNNNNDNNDKNDNDVTYKEGTVIAIGEDEYTIDDKGNLVDKDGNIIKLHVSNKTNDLTCFRSVYHFAEKEKETVEKHKDKITNVVKKGSSLKACLIAEGKGEISYRLTSGTKEWDTAAFDLIVQESGGYVVKLDGTRMAYNREDVRNLDPYVIVNKLENILL